MMSAKKLFLTGSICLLPAIAIAQGLDPSAILKPLSQDWPTYSGDYSGMRYSRLTQINQSNVRT
jgi:alcohol dehydrogenase (cytochrome c)